MAAVEDLNLVVARETALSARRASQAIGDRVNEARAELLLRQIDYRMGVASAVDSELLEAAAGLPDAGTRGVLRLNEAAVAWRSRQLARAHDLAKAAAADLRSSGFRVAAGLAVSLACECGRPPSPDDRDEIRQIARDAHPIGLVAQTLALTDMPIEDPAVVDALRASLEWARQTRGLDVRREVLTPRETLARLKERETAYKTAGRKPRE
jgi:hypothetical protein